MKMKIVKFTQRDGFTDIDIDSVMTWREGQSEDDALKESGFQLIEFISADGGTLSPDEFFGSWQVFCDNEGHHYFTYDDGVDTSELLFCENFSDAFALKLKLRADMQARHLSVGVRELSMCLQRAFRHWLVVHEHAEHDFDDNCSDCETDRERRQREADEKASGS